MSNNLRMRAFAVAFFVISVLVAGIVALLANGLPNNLGLMIAALSGITTGIIAERMGKS